MLFVWSTYIWYGSGMGLFFWKKIGGVGMLLNYIPFPQSWLFQGHPQRSFCESQRQPRLPQNATVPKESCLHCFQNKTNDNSSSGVGTSHPVAECHVCWGGLYWIMSRTFPKSVCESQELSRHVERKSYPTTLPNNEKFPGIRRKHNR